MKSAVSSDLASVLEISNKLMMALTRLTWVTSGYGWLTVVAPIVIAAPVYFNGNLSFGGLMMAAVGVQSGKCIAALVCR
ncbi:hypothetical protein LP421_15895 [Rhizobium sp. RCAM05350]|nr:hypothetical protein LP421_15895 [Rhizobium sp. RCAM05350]